MLLGAMPVLAYFGLTIYATIDCCQMPEADLPGASRGRWLTVILLVPVVGAVAWLVAGRPARGRHGRAASGIGRPEGYGWTAEGLDRHPIGPDDDADFLAGLGRAQRERNRLLTRQEEDRRRREEKRRRDPGEELDRE